MEVLFSYYKLGDNIESKILYVTSSNNVYNDINTR